MKREWCIVGLLFFGTGCSILAKLIYYAHGPGLYSDDQRFEKPWWQVFTMFLGMSICVILDRLSPQPEAASTSTKDRVSNKGDAQESEVTPLILNPAAAPPVHSPPSVKQSLLWINLPTLFDLFATGCGTTGLLYTTVSVYQMLRGAQLIFAALLSIIFLKRRLDRLNWAGIALCVLGITLVGLANVVSEANPKGQAEQLFGVVIIVIGQIMQASQVVCEEFLLRDLQLSTVKIVAWEGVFGMAHMVLWVMPIIYLLPGRDHGHLEDSVDSAYMFFHTWQVLAVIISDMIMMLFYNIAGIGVTDGFSAVHRVVIETLRTLCAWLVDLFLFYVVTGRSFGEQWTAYSWVQLGGFVLLVLGTLVYNYRLIAYENKLPTPEELGHIVVEHDGARVAHSPAATRPSAASPPHKPASKPVDFDEENDAAEDEVPEEALVGSFYGPRFGSAAHSPFLAVMRDVGSPHLSHAA